MRSLRLPDFAGMLLVLASAVSPIRNSFASYNCPTKGGTPNVDHLNGKATGQSVGVLINSDTFSVMTANGKGVGDTVIILGAFSTALHRHIKRSRVHRQLRGIRGRIHRSNPGHFEGLGLLSSGCSSANLSYGYVTLGTLGATVSITASGVQRPCSERLGFGRS